MVLPVLFIQIAEAVYLATSFISIFRPQFVQLLSVPDCPEHRASRLGTGVLGKANAVANAVEAAKMLTQRFQTIGQTS